MFGIAYWEETISTLEVIFSAFHMIKLNFQDRIKLLVFWHFLHLPICVHVRTCGFGINTSESSKDSHPLTSGGETENERKKKRKKEREKERKKRKKDRKKK